MPRFLRYKVQRGRVVNRLFLLLSALCLALVFPAVNSAITIDTVRVGNAGNPGRFHPTLGLGRVAYIYEISKYEVTAAQYTALLNSVAATDTYNLYSSMMAAGSGISRNGSAGSYGYSVATAFANRPVGYVSWGDAARFANWIANGQPTGAQNSQTTENGSYPLNGATTDAALLAVQRKVGATWVLPATNEWFKAAYHKNDGVTNNYFEYPTSSDDIPGREIA